MAKVAPFKAIRPVRDKVHLVATRPYYSYKKNVLKAKLEDNPFTFLHIINPEFGPHKKTKPNSDERFQLVKARFDDFFNDGIFIQDKSPRLYLYRQTTPIGVFLGVIGGASVAAYESDDIKKHESTLTAREDVFTRYLEIVGFNAEPVLMSYRTTADITKLLHQFVEVRPEYEFTTTDRIKHEMWVLSEEHTLQLTNAFEAVNALYIADGHHRSASSVRFCQKSRESTNYLKDSEFFLSYLVDENDLEILPFHRLVKTLNGYSKESFLHALSALGNISELDGPHEPNEVHQINVCVEGAWFAFRPFDYLIEDQHPVKSLDTDILTNLILQPILGIEDLKTSSEIEFVPGNESLELFEEKILSGKFSIGFTLFPISIEQVKCVADHGMNMPPKSTWVEPKLRSGLTIYAMEE
jgi:uncharacterized protein (DUF1015 family)